MTRVHLDDFARPRFASPLRDPFWIPLRWIDRGRPRTAEACRDAGFSKAETAWIMDRINRALERRKAKR